MKNKAAIIFLITALLALLIGVFFGLMAALQYLIPEFLKEIIPFHKMRPFHVTTVITWIVLSATGSIYFYLTQVEKLKLFSNKLMKLHLGIFLITGLGIYLSYIFGKMDGREYLAFTHILTIPILFGWLLFGINYFKTMLKQINNWPVYYWMWGTGIVFMIIHLTEAHLWLFPYFREHVIKDLTVQWKSYGSFVGSWNMLVYGISIYLMSKIKGDDSIGRNKLSFFFYFLGLTNLMFGWAHHTYIVPTLPWIRFVAYGVSMTEWIILGYMIYEWKKNLSQTKKESYPLTYKFLVTTDFWIFINLILALLFSIPAINFFTHGTHITVAHSMGTTIGINTTILLASLLFIISKISIFTKKQEKIIKRGLWGFNITLFLFFTSLLIAGARRSHWMYAGNDTSFSSMQDSLFWVYMVFFVFGMALTTSISIIGLPILKKLINYLRI
ncbi:cbb3-type cytochrome c oxidase subunit I [Formosa maritima]|uniref:Cbb3-type cytochrome c oxidase subunit I n=1 Tax=Formosa maritima TaxID=2592046 RepID=A0A5D0G0V6_9FLAO|nr:cbb3-type cytochrome c oxidase subunit I [Formosa maritima]TYA52364.1 cbb3-type cytochrome c oxidase subunit I [Formosa maritima]